MEIRDPIHGPIMITPRERMVLDHPLVQRLRRLAQLGFGQFAFPGATHTRFLHSLGTLHLAEAAFTAVSRCLDFVSGPDIDRARATLRLAALLHDLGHPPLSHSGERILPRAGSVGLSRGSGSREPITHEEMTCFLLVRSGLADLIRTEYADCGVEPEHVAALIANEPMSPDPFVFGGVSLQPLLRRLISSELDVDRMDYLFRDSYFTGVAYGRFDKDWILSHMGAHKVGNEMRLTLDSSAIFTFEDFLLSRFHMFLMVYLHHKTIVYHRLLERFLQGSGHRIRVPSDPDDFAGCDDEWLYSRIRRSDDPWAHRIATRRPLRLAIEAWDEDAAELDGLRGSLDANLPESCEWVDSEVEFSKYFPGDTAAPSDDTPPLLVKMARHGTRRDLVPVGEYSDIFVKRASRKRVLRIFCAGSDIRHVEETVGRFMGRIERNDNIGERKDG